MQYNHACYGYDQYGRPIPAPPGYPSPLDDMIKRLDERMKGLEGRIDGRTNNQVNNAQQPPGVHSQNSEAGGNFPNDGSPGGLFVSVKNAEDAWGYKLTPTQMMTGEEVWFRNELAEELYLKRYDAEKPETVREVYRKVPRSEEDIANKGEPLIFNPGLMEFVSGIVDRIGDMENKLDALLDLVKRKESSSPTQEPEFKPKSAPPRATRTGRKS